MFIVRWGICLINSVFYFIILIGSYINCILTKNHFIIIKVSNLILLDQLSIISYGSFAIYYCFPVIVIKCCTYTCDSKGFCIYSIVFVCCPAFKVYTFRKCSCTRIIQNFFHIVRLLYINCNFSCSFSCFNNELNC